MREMLCLRALSLSTRTGNKTSPRQQVQFELADILVSNIGGNYSRHPSLHSMDQNLSRS